MNEMISWLGSIGINSSGGSLPKLQRSLSELTFVQGSSHSKSQTNVTNRSTDRPKTGEEPTGSHSVIGFNKFVIKLCCSTADEKSGNVSFCS